VYKRFVKEEAMSFAAFVDSPDANKDLAIELTIALAEYCVEENEPLFLLADAVTALEVGMSLIGSRESRTVEGGDYRASPIVLLPFIPRPKSWEDDILRATSESGAGGEIEELYELGMFARRGEGFAELVLGDEPAFALSEVIARANPNRIFGLGSTSGYWQAVSSGFERAGPTYTPQLIMIDGFGSDVVLGRSERAYVNRPEFAKIGRVARELAHEGEEFEAIRNEAERDGALVAGFYNYLTQHTAGGMEPQAFK
jgi:hypothetical protein